MSAATSSAPRVSVLLPVHDGRAFLAEAIDSILAQTFRDFELLVIDDGSRDGSAKLLAGYDDPRIRPVRHEHNRGLIETLNHGLELARGEIVARMDADDVSLPERLRRQLDFLDAHPQVGACGSFVATFGDRQGTLAYPTAPDDVRCGLLFENALAHPSVCLRRDWFVRHGLRFDPAFPHAEDYDLWRRACEHFPLANLGEVLLRQRVHGASVTSTRAAEQRASVGRIHRELLAALGLRAGDAELRLHAGRDPAPLPETEAWLLALLAANDRCARYPREALLRVLGRRWERAATRALRSGRPAALRFLRSPLAREVPGVRRLVVALRAVKRRLRPAAPGAIKESDPLADA